MLSRIVNRQRSLLLVGSGLVIGATVLYPFYGSRAIAALLAVLLVYLAVTLGVGMLAQLSARTRLSLRWKISGSIFLMLGVLLAVSIAGLAAINYTHGEIHGIQEFRELSPRPLLANLLQETEGPARDLLRQMMTRNSQMVAALDGLENTQHGILTWTPWDRFRRWSYSRCTWGGAVVVNGPPTGEDK